MTREEMLDLLEKLIKESMNSVANTNSHAIKMFFRGQGNMAILIRSIVDKEWKP